MKTAIIGASGEALHTIEKARKSGLKVIALDGDPKAAGLSAADEAVVTDITDEALVIDTLRKERPDFLLTVPIGRYLTTTGAVNDALGLPGISREMAVLCTDKLLFHEKLHGAGLRQCRCYGWDGFRLKDAKREVGRGTEEFFREQEIRFPAILKPRYGSGSRGIHMIFDREELQKALKEVSGEPYLLEECVAGEEYGVDGAVTKDGFQMVLLRKKENTPLPFRQAVGYYSVQPGEDFWKQVEEYMRRTVKCLGLKECLLHGDIIRSEHGPFAIEVSARPSGHNLHNLFTPMCTGVDMAEEYIKYRMGLSCDFVPHKTGRMLIHYFDLQGKIAYIPSKEQVRKALRARLLAWQCNIKAGDELKAAGDGHSLMGRGYFVLEDERGKDRNTEENDAFLKDQAERVKELFG